MLFWISQKSQAFYFSRLSVPVFVLLNLNHEYFDVALCEKLWKKRKMLWIKYCTRESILHMDHAWVIKQVFIYHHWQLSTYQVESRNRNNKSVLLKQYHMMHLLYTNDYNFVQFNLALYCILFSILQVLHFAELNILLLWFKHPKCQWWLYMLNLPKICDSLSSFQNLSLTSADWLGKTPGENPENI